MAEKSKFRPTELARATLEYLFVQMVNKTKISSSSSKCVIIVDTCDMLTHVT